jgi:hypothetical protein
VSETGARFPGETEAPAERMVYATWVLEKRETERHSIDQRKVKQIISTMDQHRPA